MRTHYTLEDSLFTFLLCGREGVSLTPRGGLVTGGVQDVQGLLTLEKKDNLINLGSEAVFDTTSSAEGGCRATKARDTRVSGTYEGVQTKGTFLPFIRHINYLRPTPCHLILQEWLCSDLLL